MPHCATRSQAPHLRLRPGDRVPLLVTLAHLYVFDQDGRRICPTPAEQPGLVD
jgi:multiple sugar transport system ATP-binding protein